VFWKVARSVASYVQVDGFRRGTLSHSVDQERENGRSKILQGDPVKHHEPLDLVEAQGGYSENV
jgi:hypothetical protein